MAKEFPRVMRTNINKQIDDIQMRMGKLYQAVRNVEVDSSLKNDIEKQRDKVIAATEKIRDIVAGKKGLLDRIFG